MPKSLSSAMQKKTTKSQRSTTLIKPSMPMNWVLVRNVLVLVLVAVLVITTIQINTLKPLVKQKIAASQEDARPAAIQLKVIEATCADCFNISLLIDALKKSHVNITSTTTLTATSPETQQLIQQYNITRLPTVIVLGEYNKTKLPVVTEKQGYAILDATPAPYYDPQQKKVRGLVEVTLIKEPTCTKCTDLRFMLTQLEQGFGIKIKKVTEINAKDATSLLSQYKVTQVPVMILSSELSAYPELTSRWQLAGTIAQDGKYVFSKVNPPVYDLEKKGTVGLVTVTYLNDSTCKECYDVTIHKTILTNFGMVLDKEKTVDINSAEGKALKEKFKIEKVPTIILDEQASVYPVVLQVWSQVGKEIQDQFVFTQVDQLGMPYKDLVTNKVITPQPQEDEEH